MPAGEASTERSRSVPSPSAASTIRRVTIACETRTTVAPSCSAMQLARPLATRAATSSTVSPPPGRTLRGSADHASDSSGKRTATSARVSPAQAPKSISRKAGSRRTASLWGAAIGSAEARARCSGLA